MRISIKLYTVVESTWPVPAASATWSNVENDGKWDVRLLPGRIQMVVFSCFCMFCQVVHSFLVDFKAILERAAGNQACFLIFFVFRLFLDDRFKDSDLHDRNSFIFLNLQIFEFSQILILKNLIPAWFLATTSGTRHGCFCWWLFLVVFLVRTLRYESPLLLQARVDLEAGGRYRALMGWAHTVDGSEIPWSLQGSKSTMHSRWLGMGFLNHQRGKLH